MVTEQELRRSIVGNFEGFQWKINRNLKIDDLHCIVCESNNWELLISNVNNYNEDTKIMTTRTELNNNKLFCCNCNEERDNTQMGTIAFLRDKKLSSLINKE